MSCVVRTSAKKYFFQAGLCRLASGKPIDDSRANITAYQDFDPTFKQQREGVFLLDACDAIEMGDAEEFTRKITAFDQISQLDPWTTCICLRIKKSIATAETRELDLSADVSVGETSTAATAASAAPGGDDDDLC